VDAWPARPRDGLPGEAYAMMEGARRLSLNFRFGSAASLLDAKAQRDLDRVAAFLRERAAAAGAGAEVLLFGYADTGETQPYFAMTLSIDRVDYIATELARRGVAVSRVRGLGAVAPVTADRGARGQARNRRVEVWLR
jgi:phosphate transport system substrate-binding protein